MPYLGILKLEFEKSAVIYFTQTPSNFQMQSFVQYKKTSNLGQKLFYLGTFRLQFLKNYCHSAKNTLYKYFSGKISNIMVSFEIIILKLLVQK